MVDQAGKDRPGERGRLACLTRRRRLSRPRRPTRSPAPPTAGGSLSGSRPISGRTATAPLWRGEWPVDLGTVFPTTRIGNDPAVIRDFAQTAEGLGYRRLLAYD